ncbi:unnamed protein product [marine sediment metagenome]|uniref:HIRAN domain-containing protein n=1 Tax=marine sediment metagenome TaxID=412755 RepID=X0RZV1_9ZZZZ
MKLPVNINVAGVSFHQKEVSMVRARAWFMLVPEPDNPHDLNGTAIRVDAYGKFKVGYIPAKMSKEVSEMLDTGELHCFADLVQANVSGKHKTIGLKIKLKRGNAQ